MKRRQTLNFHNIDNKKILVELIELYQIHVEQLATKLAECLNIDNICNRTILREQNIPLKGICEKYSLEYSFHGVGCQITTEAIEIDFDFDNDCILKNFKLWNIWCFVSDNKLDDKFNIFKNKNHLEQTFSSLDNTTQIGDEYYFDNHKK